MTGALKNRSPSTATLRWKPTPPGWKTIAFSTIVLQAMGILSLTTQHQPHTAKLRSSTPDSSSSCCCCNNNNHDLFPDRRSALRELFCGVAATITSTTTAMVLAPGSASAGIDVSGLKVEQNPLDVFLGGTYFEDDTDDNGLDGRISRRKYTILEANRGQTLLGGDAPPQKKQAGFFVGLQDRPVVIRGESTSISSSRDNGFELQGNLHLCTEPTMSKSGGSQGCITIDFSPLGGPAAAEGYWDDKEKGIRFVDSQKVWLKQ